MGCLRLGGQKGEGMNLEEVGEVGHGKDKL